MQQQKGPLGKLLGVFGCECPLFLLVAAMLCVAAQACTVKQFHYKVPLKQSSGVCTVTFSLPSLWVCPCEQHEEVQIMTLSLVALCILQYLLTLILVMCSATPGRGGQAKGCL